MDEKKFKKTFKPAACTQAPWAAVIPESIRDATLYKIRQETQQIYGYTMDECPKRKVCLTKDCIGRPLPWKSPTAKPYLDELKKTHTITNNELFITMCGVCPIATTCKTPCAQVDDFLQRDKSEEPKLEYRENLDNIVAEPSYQKDIISDLLANSLDIPWDAIHPKRQLTVRKYLYENKDFLTIAKEMKYHDQSRARYEFYAALTTLAEYATMRKFLSEHSEKLTAKQREMLRLVYIDHCTITQAADIYSQTKQSTQQMLARVVTKHKIKWNKYVYKKGNKVIYNVPELLK